MEKEGTMTIIVHDCQTVVKEKRDEAEEGMKQSLGAISLQLAQLELRAWCNYAKEHGPKEDESRK